MTAADVLERTWLAEVARFDRAVVAWVDAEGYPVSAPADFRVDTDQSLVLLDLGPASDGPGGKRPVLVTFSHVNPRPGVGYDERRYVNLRGRLRRAGGEWALDVEHIAGWDEERVPFFEYCERNVARGLDYMQRLSDEQGRRRAIRAPGRQWA